ncbi:hypothetical protein TH61_07220 [Rufibacter sp. DG15C]|uniref:carboxypeptidase-like regulatory domain-containing protein n=1 Tax=Rufibacter sp. DG15C TaxID=1379909 RepID=UPI00078E8F62|nr:carboxypeptidase-like regulatory domain-containing protein [Rufibacter sp. DG15C]AMM51018.1 hypothetical protein TH61_07220 [Rufibacter sp. DG15C]
MFKSRLTVTVPEPCHEDWNAMTRQDEGRFCHNCQKTVVDFTSMTDAEVVRWLTKQEGNTCGRFTEKQLARELVATKASAQSWTWRAVALGLSAWLSTKTAEAQTKNNTPTTHESLFTTLGVQPQDKNTLPTQDSIITIKGQVLDAQTKEEIPGVYIQLKGSTIAVPSDAKGKFVMNIPNSDRLNQGVVVFSFIGYKTQERSLADLMKQEMAIISIGVDENVLSGEVIIVGGSFWRTPRKLYYRVRNLFH